jgi:hypothetical protein
MLREHQTRYDGSQAISTGTVLLRSRDGFVKVVVDQAGAWLGADRRLYNSAEVMTAAQGGS